MFKYMFSSGYLDRGVSTADAEMRAANARNTAGYDRVFTF
jgi:hypothetical protein